MSVATVQLGKLATVIGGYAFKSRDFVEQGVPVVKIANVTWNGVDLGDSLFLPDEFLSIKDKFHVNCGDVFDISYWLTIVSTKFRSRQSRTIHLRHHCASQPTRGQTYPS